MINFAVIGCGRIAPFHREAIRETEGAELVAVCDIDERKADSFTQGNEKVYNDYHELLIDPRIDVVNICTEHHLHSKIAMEAMEAGKHIIVEKPVAVSIEEADKMLEVEKRTGVKATVVFQNRYNKSVELTRQALKEMRFGELIHGSASVRWNRDQSYYNQDPWRGTKSMKDGFLMNQSIHTIDLLIWMMGPVKKVMGLVRTKNLDIEMENIGTAILEFENGTLGTVEGIGAAYPKDLEGRLSLFGEKGTVVIGGTATNKLETWRFSNNFEEEQERIMEYLRSQDKEAPTVYGFGHEKVVRDMVEAIRNDRDPSVRLLDGKNALEVILAIYESSSKDGEAIWL